MRSFVVGLLRCVPWSSLRTSGHRGGSFRAALVPSGEPPRATEAELRAERIGRGAAAEAAIHAVFRSGTSPPVIAAVLVLLAGPQLSARAGQNSLAEIRGKGYVRVCADPANLPFSSSRGGTPGFEVELAQAVAEELGVEAQFQWILTWVRPVWELKKGNCDLFLGLPPTARFKQSNPWIAVSRPYYTMTYAVFTRSDAGVAGPADLTGKRVAVDAGRPAEYYLLAKGLERGIYKRQEAVAEAVEKREAAAGLLPYPIASWFARGKPDAVVIPLREPSLDIDLGVATRAEETTLTAAVDRAVEHLLADGTIKNILARYRAVPE